MDAESPDAFVEFARNNSILTENNIIAFLSSECTRADCDEISATMSHHLITKAIRILFMLFMQNF